MAARVLQRARAPIVAGIHVRGEDAADGRVARIVGAHIAISTRHRTARLAPAVSTRVSGRAGIAVAAGVRVRPRYALVCLRIADVVRARVAVVAARRIRARPRSSEAHGRRRRIHSGLRQSEASERAQDDYGEPCVDPRMTCRRCPCPWLHTANIGLQT